MEAGYVICEESIEHRTVVMQNKHRHVICEESIEFLMKRGTVHSHVLIPKGSSIQYAKSAR